MLIYDTQFSKKISQKQAISGCKQWNKMCRVKGVTLSKVFKNIFKFSFCLKLKVINHFSFYLNVSCLGKLRFYIYLNLILHHCLVIPGTCAWGLFVIFIVSSEAQSCLTLLDPMDCSTPGFRVHHQLPELTQTHVHQVGDAIKPSHPLSTPSPPTFNLSQHQGLCPRSQFFVSGGQSTGVSASASVLPMNIQDWFPLGLTGWISLQSKGLFKSQLTYDFYIWNTVMSGIRESLSRQSTWGISSGRNEFKELGNVPLTFPGSRPGSAAPALMGLSLLQVRNVSLPNYGQKCKTRKQTNKRNKRERILNKVFF